MATFKPTHKDPISPQSEKFEKDFKKTMIKTGAPASIREAEDFLTEVDGMLSEVEQSLKKKIFSLAKMEALVFSDPKLSAVYEDMAENGEEKYGYHYNETIQNMIFNDYVLNSPKYLQKYKMAIPKEKKRRDKSGINKLKKAGAEKMAQSGLPKQTNEVSDVEIEESTTAGSAGGAEGYTGFAGPAAFSPEGDLMGKGKKKGQKIRKPIWNTTTISESQYLTDPGAFGKFVETLNEESDAAFIGKHGSNTYGSVDNMDAENQKIIKHDIKQRKWDNNSNIKGGIALQEGDGYNFELWEKIIPAMSHEELYQGIIELDPNMTYLKDVPNIEVLKSMYFKMMMDKHNQEIGSDSPQLDEKAKSKAQQQLMGMAYAYKKGELDGEASDEVKKIAAGMSEKDLDDFASTKHKGLPDHVDENLGQPDIDYLVKAYEIINSGPHYDPAKAEMFKSNLLQMDDAQAQQVSRTLDGMVRKMGYTNPQQVMNFQNKFNEDTQTMIQDNGNSMSNKSQPTGDQSSDTPMGTQQSGGLNESDNSLLEEINKELEAFSIHHDKLKMMSEDRKTPSQIINKRVNDENPKNFKKDLQHSGVKQIIDVENELEWKDQQTDVGDPQKLGADIEKTEIKAADMKSNEALKNVGDSTNRPGDEVPKRNITTKEQEEVDLYRNGQHSLNYDNEPAERFVDRMEADQGEFFEMGEKQKEFKKDAPMFNKDTQPIEDAEVEKVQFDKNVKQKGDEVAWNERMGVGSNIKLKESFISGRYVNAIGESHIIDFKMNEVKGEINEEASQLLFPLNFTGLGNKYESKTVDKKVVVNEAVVGVMESHKFFTNGKVIFAMKNPVQQLTEGEVKEEKPAMNEEQEKMKHLLGYKPEAYVSTKGVKQNRKF